MSKRDPDHFFHSKIVKNVMACKTERDYKFEV